MKSLNFIPFPTLDSDRLRFRKLTNDDAPEILKLRGNPKTMKFIPRPLIKDIEGALEHIKMINDFSDEKCEDKKNDIEEKIENEDINIDLIIDDVKKIGDSVADEIIKVCN